MTRSPDSLVSFAVGQPAVEKRDDKAFICWQEGDANLRAAIQMNAVSASPNPPAITPIQLDLFPGRACVPTAKPATTRHIARMEPSRRDGVSGGGTQRQTIELTGETLFGPAEATSSGREAYKGETRKRGNEAGQGVGGGRSTEEPRDNRGEGRAAASIMRSKLGKAAGMPPRGKAQPRPSQAKRKAPARLDNAHELQRTLYRVAKPYGARCRKKMVGEPDAGNPHVRFDEGVQETCSSVTRLCPALQSPPSGQRLSAYGPVAEQIWGPRKSRRPERRSATLSLGWAIHRHGRLADWPTVAPRKWPLRSPPLTTERTPTTEAFSSSSEKAR